MAAPPENVLPDYATVAATLQRCSLAQGPAEVQGFALGMYIARVPEPLTAWRREFYAEFDPADVLASECRTVLDRIFASVFAAQQAPEPTLALLLPQDIVVDAARLAAVRDWCQGFLFGFGLGGEAATRQMSAPARELLGDIAEFTRLDTDAVVDNQENRAALIEIEEYLREGVMLMRDEMEHERNPG